MLQNCPKGTLANYENVIQILYLKSFYSFTSFSLTFLVWFLLTMDNFTYNHAFENNVRVTNNNRHRTISLNERLNGVRMSVYSYYFCFYRNIWYPLSKMLRLSEGFCSSLVFLYMTLDNILMNKISLCCLSSITPQLQPTLASSHGKFVARHFQFTMIGVVCFCITTIPLN